MTAHPLSQSRKAAKKDRKKTLRLCESGIKLDMKPRIVEGDLLQQDVEVIVNSWNRNLLPWWLLLPQGVSGAIKKHGGYQPFRELRKYGMIPVGGAVETSAGNLPFASIIHVAGITLFWVATRFSIQESVRNAMKIVKTKGYVSVAFPIIGSGSGNRNREKALAYMLDAFEKMHTDADVSIVRYIKKS
jgi:O-acetyl-ADP-ribose deacetylase (regulator of RNase III)